MNKTAIHITAKFRSRCVHCAQPIVEREHVAFDTTNRKVYHIDCANTAGFEVVENDVRTKLLNKPNAATLAALGVPVASPPSAARDSDSSAIASLQRAVETTFTAIERDITALRGHDGAIDARLAAIETELAGLRQAQRQHIVLERGNSAPPVDLGLQHERFETLLRVCNARGPDGARLNVWLAGPAGSGKTTAAKNVAKALGVPFFSNGALDQKYELKGFTDAQGRIVSTQFRDAWTQPSVYLFDEVDGSLNTAVLPFNAALANGLADFPGAGLTPRHADCIVIAAGNTWGLGGTAQYVGRMRLDAAFLDRFVQLDWPIDETLEALTAPHEEWCKYVQKVRRRVRDRGLQHMITPRATYSGAALLAQDIPWDSVVRMTLRKGLTEEQWKEVA